MRTSLQTALRAGSMVSPARRMDTPVILGGVKAARSDTKENVSHGNHSWVETRPHPLPLEGPAFVVLPLRGVDHVDLLGDTSSQVRSDCVCM